MTSAKRPYEKPILKKSLVLQSVTALQTSSAPPDDDTTIDLGGQ